MINGEYAARAEPQANEVCGMAAKTRKMAYKLRLALLEHCGARDSIYSGFAATWYYLFTNKTQGSYSSL